MKKAVRERLPSPLVMVTAIVALWEKRDRNWKLDVKLFSRQLTVPIADK